ncbi:recombinase family protein [Rhodanobacter sp. MP7CTX1]|uniref:recombinase family protein n=1 Tax=Rhodanobacter sp. MP7CTX1 TaxID=2723084 RepID=UPI0018308367|nr:recombinase family protein [Rhodanobacter sp. MP7CTX1]MBB6187567.1 DNA invertase Pin-like site-specific DNA recombinase [Rhodanobacter sp. MP7CTX1]
MRVAQYVRMSTDHQRYSTENQRETIGKYAAQRGMVIVQTYADEGKSGLSLEGRAALKQLIQDVQSGRPNFDAILVYDISRWGRFQDADESAYYEYLCRRSGIQVRYCTEPFENDGSPMATIMKSVKRAMAGEYSRELSNKVFQGQCRLIELGFRQGGAPGFGLRRMLLDEYRMPKGALRHGEKKSLQTDRVVLVPGPEDEVATVRYIYREFLESGKPERTIADALNAAGQQTNQERAWTRGTVHQILTNEKYIGNNVYNRTSFKLKQRRVRNNPDMWIRRDGAFDPVIPVEWFARAQEAIAARSQRMDDASMLQLLQSLYAQTGVLSGLLIDEQEGMPSSSAYRARFGGLVRAYSLIGFRPRRDYRYLEINQALRAMVPNIIAEVVTGLKGLDASVSLDEGTGLLLVNDEFTLSVVIARCLQLPSGTFRWRLRFDTSLAPDITVVVRMAADQHTVLDYYLFPQIDLPLRPLRLAEENNEVTLDAYRFDVLDALYQLAARRPLSNVA